MNKVTSLGEKKAKVLILIIVNMLLMISIFTISTNEASALTFKGRFNTGKLNAAVAGPYSSKEISRILSYVKKWNGISSKVSISTSSASYSNSKLRIRYKLDKPSNSGTLGLTKLYGKNKKEVSISSTWWYATCIVYKNSTTGYNATLVHETGHSLSMAHCITTQAHPQSLKHIMHQGVKSYTAISSYEKSQLKSKWGK